MLRIVDTVDDSQIEKMGIQRATQRRWTSEDSESEGY